MAVSKLRTCHYGLLKCHWSIYYSALPPQFDMYSDICLVSVKASFAFVIYLDLCVALFTVAA